MRATRTCIGAPAGKEVHAGLFGGHKLHFEFNMIGVAPLSFCYVFLFRRPTPQTMHELSCRAGKKAHAEFVGG